MRLLLAFVLALYGVAFLWGADQRENMQPPGPRDPSRSGQTFSSAHVQSQMQAQAQVPSVLSVATRPVQLAIDPARDDGRTVTVPVPGAFVLELPAQSGTGYQWDIVGTLPPFLSFRGMRVSDTPGQAPGAAKPQLLTFDVVSAGQTTVQLAYRQPWNAANSEVRRVRLKLIAQ
jgi:predicted secreted protein